MNESIRTITDLFDTKQEAEMWTLFNRYLNPMYSGYTDNLDETFTILEDEELFSKEEN